MPSRRPTRRCPRRPRWFCRGRRGERSRSRWPFRTATPNARRTDMMAQCLHPTQPLGRTAARDTGAVARWTCAKGEAAVLGRDASHGSNTPRSDEAEADSLESEGGHRWEDEVSKFRVLLRVCVRLFDARVSGCRPWARGCCTLFSRVHLCPPPRTYPARALGAHRVLEPAGGRLTHESKRGAPVALAPPECPRKKC